MIYTVEPEGAPTIVESYLILGVAKQAASKKRALKQAPALRVDMVLQLHAILRHQSLDAFDRLAAGLILMCVYGRCRCSDLRYVQELLLDVTGRHGFIEVRTEFHKTANKEKRKLLPIVAPAFGVTDENWAQQFLLLREESLGEFQPGPFLPAPLLEGKFSERHIDSDEFTSLLRHLLREFAGAQELTSHSCKKTALSWMAKYGADKPTLDFLGRHVGSITSSDIYARGMQSRPLRKLAMALNSIRAGTFAPDETRSGLFRRPADSSPLRPEASDFCPERFMPRRLAFDTQDSPLSSPAEKASSPMGDDERALHYPPPVEHTEATEAEKVHTRQASSQSGGSSSSSSSSESSSSTEGPGPMAAADNLHFLNPKGKVHILAAPGGITFRCGRKWHANMVPVGPRGQSSTICSQCDPAAFPIKTKADLIAAINARLKR